MELSQVTSAGQSSIFYSKDDLILGPASLKGSTGGLFPRAWIILLPHLLHRIKETDFT